MQRYHSPLPVHDEHGRNPRQISSPTQVAIKKAGLVVEENGRALSLVGKNLLQGRVHLGTAFCLQEGLYPADDPATPACRKTPPALILPKVPRSILMSPCLALSACTISNGQGREVKWDRSLWPICLLLRTTYVP